MEDNLKLQQIEEDLNILANARETQYFFPWKMTLFAKCKTTKILLHLQTYNQVHALHVSVTPKVKVKLGCDNIVPGELSGFVKGC